MDMIQTLARELNLRPEQVEKTVALIDEGNTIPFIARYRKEVTGSLDDSVLRTLDERLKTLRNLEKRKEEVRGLIDAQGKLTPEVSAAIEGAVTVTEVEDIYRPYRPKRRTRASIARERGLEDLAVLLFAQEKTYTPALEEQAAAFVDEERGVPDTAAALGGAMDIIAEEVSDNAEYRKNLRALTVEYGSLCVKATGEEDSVYSMYYDYTESLKKIPGHRVLAINRGEKEGFLKVTLTVPDEVVLNYLYNQVITNPRSPAAGYVNQAVTDSYTRLIAPSLEREIRGDLFDNACEGAIKVFSDNLSHLLMQPPLKGKTVLGFDPGYAHGCKLAVVDRTGKVLDTAVVYPTIKPRVEEAARTVKRLIRTYGVDVVAIGNGTASRESEAFIADILKQVDRPCKYIIVSEAGASIYSASELAAEEFPEFDVMQRSAVSIARRLQDPLAELVKIDPKGIGVGQYQHDMKPARLDEALGGVVENCVNAVGVDVNTASYSLLSYISGINATAAKNIVKYREANGEFSDRSQLMKVPHIGARAYQQCAGFLRIPGGREILDNTGVHPESYDSTRALLRMFGYTEEDVRAGHMGKLRGEVTKKGIPSVCEALHIGEPT
ncbi:MAG: Tex-like N-terminal domain-containing protein, partial [Eubacteriales bacterium]